MAETRDVVVVGAGVVGCAIARALTLDGIRPLVIDRGEIARQASFVAGGVLDPLQLHTYPPAMQDLCPKALAAHDRWVPAITEASGIDPEYEEIGQFILVRDDEDDAGAEMILAFRKEKDLPVESLTAAEAGLRIPGLAEGFRRALYLPDVRQVRTPRLNRAMAAAAERGGAVFRTGVRVTGLIPEGVRAGEEEIHAGVVVIAAGAWSGDPALSVGDPLKIIPIRGQMILTEATPSPFRSMVIWKGRYIIPRRDGKILMGTTHEEAGLEARTTARGVSEILATCQEMIPTLANGPFLNAWAGLRPSTPDGLPYIGRIPERESVIVATGHHRNGILLGPLTGEIVAGIIAGREPPLPLEPYAPRRG